jgi:hypothetical protein
LRYPEERDPAYVKSCVGNLEEAEEREKAGREADPAVGSGETFSNYTLTAQISHARTADSSRSITSAKMAADLEKDREFTIIGWAGPNDPEVRIFKSPPFDCFNL